MNSELTGRINCPPNRHLGLTLWCATGVFFFLLYLGTAQRGVSWQDSGIFQWRVLNGDYSGDMGLALAHPLYIAAGRVLALFPQRHLPFLLNAFSGLGMAVALANLAALGTFLTGRRWIALLTAAMLGVCHTVWWLSTIAETYTWSVAGLTAELYLLAVLIRRPRWTVLTGLMLVNGLGLCLHNLALLPLPVYCCVAVVLVVRRRIPAWSLAAAAGTYLLGAGMFLVMIAQLIAQNHDVLGAIRSALVGNYGGEVMNVGGASKNWQANTVLAGMNFLNLLLPLGVLGWVRFRRRLGTGLAAALGAVALIELVFFVRYPIPDQFTFILPTLVMIATAAAVGLDELRRWRRRWRRVAVTLCLLSLIAQPVFFATAPRLARNFTQKVRKRQLPFRDELRYWLVPWKHNEQSASLFAAAALGEVEPNAVILPDSTSLYPLLLVQRLDGLRGDVSLQHGSHPFPNYKRRPEAFLAAASSRPFYVVSDAPGYLPPLLLTKAALERRNGAVLYQVHWKSP